MNAFKLMDVLKKYEKCPKCGNNKIGNGEGGIVVEDDTYTRTCKCGFKITVNENGKEIKGEK